MRFSSLPLELVTIVAEQLDTRSLANFAAASAACLAAAQNELRVALTAAVKRCLLRGRCRGMDKLVASPHFVLPDGLVAIPAGAFRHCTSLIQLTLPATVTIIGNGAFWGCSKLTKLTLSTALATIGDRAFNHCSSLAEFNLPANRFTRPPTWHGTHASCLFRLRLRVDSYACRCEDVLCTECMSQLRSGGEYRGVCEYRVAPMRRVVVDLEPEEGVDAARPILLD